ncbi:MAG: hypothetical protein NZ992_00820 [Candidatus Korarchaeum sp.]|nr:hypothetical protein [Candidatus Korarchaeum sp.]
MSYRIVSEVNMAKRIEGCTESPVATFLRLARELKEGEGILLTLDKSSFPVKAAEALAKRMGLKFECLDEEDDFDKCVAYRT